MNRLDLSFAHGTSNSNPGASEGAVELFYQRRSGPTLHITPDFQFVLGGGIGGNADWIMIAGLRVGFELSMRPHPSCRDESHDCYAQNPSGSGQLYNYKVGTVKQIDRLNGFRYKM